MKRAMLDKSIEKTTALSAAFAAAAQQQSAAAAMASALRGAVNGMMSLPMGGQLGQFPMSVGGGVGAGASTNTSVFPLCAAANYYGGAAGLAGMSQSAAGAAAAAAGGGPNSYWYGNLASNFASSLTGAGAGVNVGVGGQSAQAAAATGGQSQSYSSQTYPSVYVPCARLYSNNNNSGTGTVSPQAKAGEKLVGGDGSEKVLSPTYEKRFASPLGTSSYKPSDALSSAAAAAGVFDLTGAASGGSYAESYMAAFQSNLLHANSAAAAAAANMGSGSEGGLGMMWPGAPATAGGLHVGAMPQAESLLGAVGSTFPFGSAATGGSLGSLGAHSPLTPPTRPSAAADYSSRGWPLN